MPPNRQAAIASWEPAIEHGGGCANGRNLMFCEDAARRVQHALDADGSIADFHIRIVHKESLHPHNAVAHARKEQQAIADGAN